MNSLNKATILGRLGSDVELKYTSSQKSVCNFSVATSDSWLDKQGQRQEKTEWHRVVVWGKLAETCNQYLEKGSRVFIEGKLETRSWDDKNGTKHYTTEIKANQVIFLDSNKKESSGQQEEYQKDDIPF